MEKKYKKRQEKACGAPSLSLDNAKVITRLTRQRYVTCIWTEGALPKKCTAN